MSRSSILFCLIFQSKKEKKLLKTTDLNNNDNEDYQDLEVEDEEMEEEEPEVGEEGANVPAKLSFNLNTNKHFDLDGRLKVPESIWSRLYPFQKTGLKWLWELHSQKCGGILGDEMGLGKTVQIISYLASLSYTKLISSSSGVEIGPVLIVAPVTLIGQWVKEFHTWWPYFRVGVLHEIGTFREGKKSKLVDRIYACNGILLTTYSSLIIYDDLLLAKNWHHVILDEGHKIRNPDARISLAAKCFRTPHRLILSGSPIQNNLKELWSLFDFIFPGRNNRCVLFYYSYYFIIFTCF